MADKKRANNADWKANRPKGGSSTNDWKNWAKTNPNRKVQARKALAETDPKSPKFVATTTQTKANTPERKAAVAKWKSARPVSGKGGAKTDADKEAKRNQMRNWAKWNPNKRSNARRTTKGK